MCNVLRPSSLQISHRMDVGVKCTNRESVHEFTLLWGNGAVQSASYLQPGLPSHQEIYTHFSWFRLLCAIVASGVITTCLFSLLISRCSSHHFLLVVSIDFSITREFMMSPLCVFSETAYSDSEVSRTVRSRLSLLMEVAVKVTSGAANSSWDLSLWGVTSESPRDCCNCCCVRPSDGIIPVRGLPVDPVDRIGTVIWCVSVGWSASEELLFPVTQSTTCLCFPAVTTRRREKNENPCLHLNTCSTIMASIIHICTVPRMSGRPSPQTQCCSL